MKNFFFLLFSAIVFLGSLTIYNKSQNISLINLSPLKEGKNISNKKYFYMGSNTGLVELNENLKILVNSQDIGVGMALIFNNSFEQTLSSLMLQFVKQGDTIIDVGANYGTHALTLAQKAYNGKNRIYAFEANPEVFKLLTRSIDINGLHGIIIPYNLLITDKEKEKYIFTYNSDQNVGGSRITETYDPNQPWNFNNFMELYSTKLDTLIPDGTKVNFMKLDIEGSEFMALAGASRIIEQSIEDIVILMEWNYNLIKGDPIENIKKFTDNYKFNVWFVQGDSKPEKIEDFSTLSNRAGDLFLSRKTLDFNS